MDFAQFLTDILDRPGRGQGRGGDLRADRHPGRGGGDRRRRHRRPVASSAWSARATRSCVTLGRDRRDPPPARGRAWRWTWPSWARWAGRRFLVATVGVITPMVLGLRRHGRCSPTTSTPSSSSGAALTATSVGITARVFGDLRALATTEARLVLGAAVADDVMGLVVLTVVVRLVTEGSVSVALGDRGSWWWRWPSWSSVASSGSGWPGRSSPSSTAFSRSTGTLVAIAFAFALGFARLAERRSWLRSWGPSSPASRSARRRRRPGSVGSWRRSVTSSSRCSSSQIGIDADISAFFSRRGAAGRRRSSWSWPWSASSSRRSGPSAPVATRSSSAWACCPAVRWASSSPPSACRKGSWATTSTPRSCSSCLATTLITPPC